MILTERSELRELGRNLRRPGDRAAILDRVLHSHHHQHPKNSHRLNAKPKAGVLLVSVSPRTPVPRGAARTITPHALGARPVLKLRYLDNRRRGLTVGEFE